LKNWDLHVQDKKKIEADRGKFVEARAVTKKNGHGGGKCNSVAGPKKGNALT